MTKTTSLAAATTGDRTCTPETSLTRSLLGYGVIAGPLYVTVSLVQALTQIQEMTLVFVPKILAIFLAMLIALPFMSDALQSHMMRLAARIVGG